jgi:maltose O-acetyltransferase
MTATNKSKMAAGEWYICMDPELDALRARASIAVHQHNTLPPDERGLVAPLLKALMADCPDNAMIEASFHCPYGFNISLGADVYLNAGCTILDSAPVTIGAATMIGPQVQIYCADHHRDATLRTQGLERGRAVTIGEKVWIGGGAIILPGVTIGDEAIIGAGSVVTRNVAAGATVVGNPARVVVPVD